MDYIQIKESAIKLADLIKIIPQEDKGILEEILKKYNNFLYTLNNVDFDNNVFSNKELRSINLVFKTEHRRICNDVIAKEIEEEFGDSIEWPDNKYDYYEKAWDLEFELDLTIKNYIVLLSRKEPSVLRSVARQTISNMIEVQFFKELNKLKISSNEK